jgi:hypothetical protein
VVDDLVDTGATMKVVRKMLPKAHDVAKPVDARDLKSLGREGRAGSTPAVRTDRPGKPTGPKGSTSLSIEAPRIGQGREPENNPPLRACC